MDFFGGPGDFFVGQWIFRFTGPWTSSCHSPMSRPGREIVLTADRNLFGHTIVVIQS